MQEIRHLNAVDHEGVLFDRVAHFVGVFRAVDRLRPQVCDRVNHHLEQLVARGSAHELIVRKRGLDEDLRDRLPVLGQVVIAERAGRVGIIEIDELPIEGFATLAL